MRSMTGFGKGSATLNASCRINAEISSVNRKQLEVRLTMPQDWSGYELPLRKLIGSAISRGTVQLRLSLDNTECSGKTLINAGLLDALIQSCIEARKRAGLPVDRINVEALLTYPGISSDSGIDVAGENFENALFCAVKAAIEDYQSMRCTEGANLKADCEARLNVLKRYAAEIRPKVGAIPAMIKARILEKLAASELKVDLNDERLLKEVLFYADKSDVTEELTRLDSHFAQFENFLNQTESAGRSIDFLIQEMFREITTLGNKAAIPAVSPYVIAFKSELEKLREQIQNVE